MAEAFVNTLCQEEFQAQSAGIEPGVLNPLVVEVMREIGIDLADKPTRGVFDLFKSGERFDSVVTVCDEASAERCPVFPGIAQRLHWSFPDPSTFTGSWEERLAQTRAVRDAIRERVSAWCAAVCPPKPPILRQQNPGF